MTESSGEEYSVAFFSIGVELKERRERQRRREKEKELEAYRLYCYLLTTLIANVSFDFHE